MLVLEHFVEAIGQRLMYGLKLFIVVLVLCLGTACGYTGAPLKFQDISYEHLGRFNLDVADVEVINEYRAPMREPYVEHLFPMSPGLAATHWAKDRLKPVGNVGKARFIVRDASVTETRLDVEEGIKGALTTDQAQRYEARLSIVIEILSETRGREAYVEAHASRARTLPEDATVNERRSMYHAMAQELLADVNIQLERNIMRYLGRFVR